jgi:hypothetical protein
LSLVEVAPNTVRAATGELGHLLAEAERTQLEALQRGEQVVSDAPPAATPLCVSLDGVQAHLMPDGWKEVCVGVVYQVRPCRPSKEGRADAVQAEALSYVAELGSRREEFGWQLYAEARRRGADKREVAVIGDGAHWLWDLAELHFPQATQILDWFHATEYVWSAASAVWSEAGEKRKQWAEQQLRALWEGRVAEVLVELERQVAYGEAVEAAKTYFTNQQGRMNYPAYRARGLPIGSGTVESGCKQVVSSRLKGAGMIWTADGARQVAKVRAWLKGGRWAAAMALRGRPQRRVRRCRQETVAQAPTAAPPGVPGGAVGAAPPARPGLPPEVLAQVRAEMAQARQHPWRRPWSSTQQRAQFEEQGGHVRPAAAA